MSCPDSVSYTHLDVYKRQVKEYGKAEIHLRLDRLEFNHQVLVAEIVDETILGVDTMNAYGFIVDFKNNVLRIGGEEVMLSTMTTAEKSKDVINQVAVTVPPNSEKIITVTTCLLYTSRCV